jgi:hypothetical protein
MARPFNGNSGKKAFGVFAEPLTEGDYIYNKKAKASYCFANNCTPNLTEGNYLLYKRSYALNHFPCRNLINKQNLNINLITKLNLKYVPVIADLSGNISPTTITSTITPYLKYNIDPSGNLFGNSVCGINNYTRYMQYNIK